MVISVTLTGIGAEVKDGRHTSSPWLMVIAGRDGLQFIAF
jgi:hypothetical protein